jgi:nickel-dependent lactate racemase
MALGYGARSVDFVYDPARFEVLAPRETSAPELNDAALADALDQKIGCARLADTVEPADRVLVVVPDATRASGSARVSGMLLSELGRMGIPDPSIEFLIGAGTHRPPTAEEIIRIVGPEVTRRVRVDHHDAFDAPAHAQVGTTSRGTPIEINRRLLETDVLILAGAIGLHYFAGFSGGRKAILPACASDRAIQANHLLGFDRTTLERAAGVGSGRLDGNPVSEDMEEAAAIVAASYTIMTVVNAASRITAVYGGHWREAHRHGCAEYLAGHSVQASEKRPVVVVSCGGAPRDINMIQSHKALEHACVVLEDDGDLILLAECGDGLGRADFLDWFVPGGARAMAERLVENYKINGQTAWGIRWKSERYRVHLVSALPPDQVRRMGMIPHASLDEALGASGAGPGYLLPHGLGTLPMIGDPERGRADAAAGAC